MDVKIKPAKLQFYDNRKTRLTAAQVRAQTGADYVINCVAFSFSTFQPVMGFRMDGRTVVLDDDYYGIAWNDASDVTMARAGAGHANYMTFVPIVRDGAAMQMYIGSDVKGARQRTAFGVYPDGDVWIYAVKSPAKTPEQIQALALEKGCAHALLLDGGGSTCASCTAEEVTTSRAIPIFLCIWAGMEMNGHAGTPAQEDAPSEEGNTTDGISTYSKKQHGGKKLTANFKVSEFACKDGTDEILIADALPVLLQEIRNHFGQPVTVTSGYRTAAYNAAVGGAKSSQHMQGTAADTVITGVSPLAAAQYAEKLLGSSGGIGLYNGFTHVDVRAARARWDSTTGAERAVEGFYADACPYTEPAANVSQGARGEAVKWVQWQLVRHGGKLDVDGIFGTATKLAVRAFQTTNGLTADGIVGPLTRAKLKG